MKEVVKSLLSSKAETLEILSAQIGGLGEGCMCFDF